MLLTFAPNSTRLFSLPLTMGRRYGRSMLTMRCLTSLPANRSDCWRHTSRTAHSRFSCSADRLMPGAVQLAEAVPLEAELGKKFQEPSPEPARGRAGVLALLGVCKRGLGNIIVLVSRYAFRQPPALANEQVVKPSATLPKQFDVCRETQVALIAGRICQAQVLVLEVALPPGVQYALKVVYVEVPGKTVAYGTYDLPVLDGIGWVYQHTAEHLHVDASVEQLYQAVVRQARVCLEEHKGDFPFCRKKGFFPRLRLWVRLANSAANSSSGSWARMRPSSLFAKLSR